MSKGELGAVPLGEIQSLIDDLAERLGRSVAVDNSHLELMCATAQNGPIDQWRINAIINREPPQEPVPWMMAHDIHRSHKPVRLPANDELEMLPRVCFPIRREGVLLGYLWLFDEPPVSSHELELAAAVVKRLLPILGSDDEVLRDRVVDLQRLTERAMKPATSLRAVQEACDLGFLSRDRDFQLHVLRLEPVHTDINNAGSERKDLRLELARRQVGRSFLARFEDDRLVTISAPASAGEVNELEGAVIRSVASVGFRVIGAGSAQARDPAVLEAASSRASFAAELADAGGAGSRILAWEELGSWRLLLGWPLDEGTVEALSPAAARLVAQGNPEHWETALAYLDSARRVPLTCETLLVHRATLYYRLDRIRSLIGAETLNDGWQAASLHAALRLHRLIVNGECGWLV